MTLRRDARGTHAYDEGGPSGGYVVRGVDTRTAAACGVVAVPDASSNGARLQGGRLLQRVHLSATANGLALQHMNQISERADREQQLGIDARFGRAAAENDRRRAMAVAVSLPDRLLDPRRLVESRQPDVARSG